MYSRATFDNAVKVASLGIARAMEHGATFSRPELCKLVACEYFLMTPEQIQSRSIKERKAFEVIQVTYRYLSFTGQFMFGDEEVDFSTLSDEPPAPTPIPSQDKRCRGKCITRRP